ncbi:MAG: transcriptional repressor LexA [Hydrotalea sp.]|nr:transcriptional repressor LexA [Hydrotalea sp.]
MLTQQQHRLLMYIQQCIAERGYAPSYEEMKNALGLKSKSGVHRLVFSLEERGYVNRLPNKARAVEVLRAPDEKLGVKANDLLKKTFISKALSKKTSKAATLSDKETGAMIPLYGKIAAGTPIAALQDPNDFVEAPAFMLGFGDFYALRIEGDSMKDAGIFDNDIVVIKKQNHADDGAIVVALIDKEEATLKKIKYSGSKVMLQPANKHYKSYELPSNRVIVQGVLRGLIRHYK